MAIVGNDIYLSSSDQQKLKDLEVKYNAASTQAEKDAIHQQGEAIRNSYGYATTGANGQQTVTDQAKLNQLKLGSTTGSSSSSGPSMQYSYGGSTLQRGSTGSEVGKMQQALADLGYLSSSDVDNSFGPKTEAALKKYQNDQIANGVDLGSYGANGILGEYTANALINSLNGKSNNDSNNNNEVLGSQSPTMQAYAYNGKLLQRGSTGADVGNMQQALVSLGYLTEADIDNSFGPKTEAALKKFQQDQIAQGVDLGSYGANGILGDYTAKALDNALKNYGNVEEGTKIEQRKITISVAARDAAGNFITDENGYLIFKDVEGFVDQNGTYTRADGQALGNGDAILDENSGQYLYYDPDSAMFIAADAWNKKNSGEEEKDQRYEDMQAQIDALYEQMYSMFQEPQDIEDFLTWAEAQQIASERVNPIYDQALEQSLSDIDNRALLTGFYGQLPTAALKEQAVATAAVERAGTIAELAQSLMNTDRDTALAMFDAQLQQKQFTANSLLDLTNLLSQYAASQANTPSTVPMVSSSSLNPNGGMIGSQTVNTGTSQNPVPSQNPSSNTNPKQSTKGNYNTVANDLNQLRQSGENSQTIQSVIASALNSGQITSEEARNLTSAYVGTTR